MNPSEFQPKLVYEIQELQPEEIDEATVMRKQSWIDTYVNAEYGIEEPWIEAHFKSKLDPSRHQARIDRFNSAKQQGILNAWVARSQAGKIIGAVTPFIEANGRQRVGSIYVDKNWHGTGLGSQLMRRIIDWFDDEKPVYLEVVSYNERAKAFYKKWGFVEIEGSEAVYAEKLPEVTMVRQPESQQKGGATHEI